MGGPQLTLRRSSRFQPFARALFGGARYSDSTNILANNVPLISDVKESDSGFALGGGGGTDVAFSSHLGLRVTVDYIRTARLGFPY
jgi:opacity protein-like surface antigen